MTTGAIRNQFLLHELPVMIILVTVGAFVMLHRGIDIGIVAGSAGNSDVFVFQFEVRFGMVKIVSALYDVKRDLRMTLCTVLSEFVLMDICMTIDAICEPDTCKLLEF